MLASSLQNSEGGGDGDSGDSCADPLHFLSFNLQLLSFTFEMFGKELAKTKTVARVNVQKIKANKYKKGFEIACDETVTIFYQNL
jgi:hypothetical protein